ncbi:MAG: aspartate--tRNA ligase [Oscillospiraceae bacterium]|nr:aspartate--tRNA ligase [Oscillospiraceae bacterium]
MRLAGWVAGIRDHGGVVFIDLRDHYGVTQVVVSDAGLVKGFGRESVISAEGLLCGRSEDTRNARIPTGEVELQADAIDVLSESSRTLPFEVSESTLSREDLRLKYRFLDLRNPTVHARITLRSEVIRFLRAQMESLGFMEVQTPILTSSSPEGARDYLVPSRKHRGMFYALPQAPQQFKQLLMASGFDRYFQIAPCFRDEDSRADRSPGEFYQLDFEMAFATQEDVFGVTERVLAATFSHFTGRRVSPAPFRRIPYSESMLAYGTDKPDLRNPLLIRDLTGHFADVDFAPFKGKPVRGIVAPGAAGAPRSFLEGMLAYATGIGMKGLGNITFEDVSVPKGPIAKFLSEEQMRRVIESLSIKVGDVLFFVSDDEKSVDGLAGQIRTELGRRLGLIDEGSYELCFVTDFPMYGIDAETGKVGFTHNPFSMPQGGMAALEAMDPLEVKAFQYDIVCNGVELSSGAVRNHRPDVMAKAFEIAGYPREDLETRFPALLSAFGYGAPPHAGMAPGIDRILMLIAGTDNIREVIAFPMNGNAQDLLMGAPGAVTEAQLREAHIRVR